MGKRCSRKSTARGRAEWEGILLFFFFFVFFKETKVEMRIMNGK